MKRRNSHAIEDSKGLMNTENGICGWKLKEVAEFLHSAYEERLRIVIRELTLFKKTQAGRCSSVVEVLPCMHKAPGSITSTIKINKKTKTYMTKH
jgi:hypothetical protein